MTDMNYDIKCFCGNKDICKIKILWNIPTLMCSSKNLLNYQLAWHLYQNQTSFLIDYLTYKNEKGWIEWNNWHKWLLKMKELNGLNKLNKLNKLNELNELIKNAEMIEIKLKEIKTN
jgi:hypothetical protein